MPIICHITVINYKSPMESAVGSPTVFDITEIVHLIHEHFTDSCPINVTGLNAWLCFGLVCKLFRSLQVHMLTKKSLYNNNDSTVTRPTADEQEMASHSIVRSVQLFQQYKEYPIAIHIQGCNPIIVDSIRRLKGDSKAELIVHNSDITVSSYLPCKPHYPSLFDFVKQKSVEASKLHQECFCLFHFRRGYFGFVIQCKIDSISKKQSVRLAKVYQTQSARYYGPVQQEANNYPAIYGAALYYLLKDCVRYKSFYVSLSTKRKRDTKDEDEEEREPKRSKNHDFYSWRQSGSNLERRLFMPTASIEEELQEVQDPQGQSDDNPVQCNCILL